MGSLYLWGRSIQEMGGDVVINRSFKFENRIWRVNWSLKGGAQVLQIFWVTWTQVSGQVVSCERLS